MDVIEKALNRYERLHEKKCMVKPKFIELIQSIIQTDSQVAFFNDRAIVSFGNFIIDIMYERNVCYVGINRDAYFVIECKRKELQETIQKYK